MRGPDRFVMRPGGLVKVTEDAAVTAFVDHRATCQSAR